MIHLRFLFFGFEDKQNRNSCNRHFKKVRPEFGLILVYVIFNGISTSHRSVQGIQNVMH